MASVLTVSAIIAVSNLHAQIVENPSDEERLYTTLGDEEGTITSKLFVTQGKAYIQGGKVAFGTGKHRLQNVDGRGQYVSIAPSQLVMFTVDKTWVLGFRVDEMHFHWGLDESRAKHVSLLVDELKIHDKKVSSIVSVGRDKRQHEFVCDDIFLKEARIVIVNLPDLPFAPVRVYITEDNQPHVSKVNSREIEASSETWPKIVIRKDGTISRQDVMLHLTGPTAGEPETLSRHAVLINEYKDKLLCLEVRGPEGDRSGLVYFDKGASVYFDESGIPIFGSGILKLQAVRPEGQVVSGWFGPVGSPYRGRKVKSLSVEFKTDDKGQPRIEFRNVVEIPVGGSEPAKTQ